MSTVKLPTTPIPSNNLSDINSYVHIQNYNQYNLFIITDISNYTVKKRGGGNDPYFQTCFF